MLLWRPVVFRSVIIRNIVRSPLGNQQSIRLLRTAVIKMSTPVVPPQDDKPSLNTQVTEGNPVKTAKQLKNEAKKQAKLEKLAKKQGAQQAQQAEVMVITRSSL